MSLRVFRGVVLCWALQQSVSAMATPALTIYTEHFPPYNFANHAGVIGINVDIVRLACQGAKITCTFEMLPWNRAYRNALDTPHAGLVSVSRTPQREGVFVWVGPLAYSQTYLYRLVARSDLAGMNRERLLNYSIGLPRNDVYEAIFTEWGFVAGRNLMLFSRKQESLHLFLRGKLDFIVGSELTLPYALAEAGLTTQSVVAAMAVNDPKLQGNFLALNPQVPVEWVDGLRLSLERLRKNGQLKSIVEHYQVCVTQPESTCRPDYSSLNINVVQ
ncbi:transporter substrate-binding domain-containing protein [Aestuariibacter halophilus]|uniref:Transporter substrate-binding domain-containing protein n=1 Tax=Fluctibacter halophilus TaxID=226011 RepID=A0ABS8G2A4_9ALTE|nr:transporter substrate-binding domain-containing protein [Aestuariibacter halophilus]MCC2614714.1 transporter substrate-binding domain-containing protein [Aestuariibacter halophilus]